MMGDVVNLKLARKRKAREAREVEASANRAKFGTPKARRELTEAERDLERKRLDGHKIEE
jgi:hypothetical protein